MPSQSKSRFERVSSLAALPGSCFACSSSNREWYVDFGIHMEFHGRLYLCSECITEIAQLGHFVTSEEKIRVDNALDALHSLNLDRSIEGLLDARGTIDTAIHRLNRVHGRVTSYVEDVSGTDQLPEGEPSEGEERVESGEGTPSEQGDEQGLGNVYQSPEQSEFEFSFGGL